MSEDKRRLYSPIGIASAVVLLALVRPGRDLFGDPGAGWHLLNGLRLLSGAAPAAADPFSFDLPVPGLWISDQWLGDLIFAAVYSAFGFTGLTVVTGVVLSLAFFYLPGRKLAHNSIDIVPLILSLVLAGSLGSIQWFFRPVIFSFLCFSILIFYVSQAVSLPAGSTAGPERRSRLRLLKIALLFVLWANLHPGFFVGLLYLLFRLADLPPLESADRRLASRYEAAIDLIVALLATGVNPFGFGLHRQAVQLAGNRYFSQLNEEWLPPDLMTMPYILVVPIAVLICVLPIIRERSRIARSDIAISLLLVCLMVQQRRYAPLAAIASIRPLTAALNEIFLRFNAAGKLVHRIGAGLAKSERHGRAWPLYSAAAAGALIILSLTGVIEEQRDRGPLQRNGFSATLQDAVRSADRICRKRGRPCRVWASPDYGGLLLWWLYRDPGISVFIDDRNQLYGEERYREYFSAAGAGPGWEELLVRREIDLVFLTGQSELRGALRRSAGWTVLYEDLAAGKINGLQSGAIIYFRKEVNDESS